MIVYTYILNMILYTKINIECFFQLMYYNINLYLTYI